MPVSITVIGNTLGWSLLSFVLAALISLFITRIVLGVRLRLLLAEIEDRQNAAVGIIFKDVSVVTSLMLLSLTSDGFTTSETLLEDILWALGGGLLTALFIGLLGFLLLRWMAGRQHLQETALGYLRRELVQERNVALANIIMAFLLIVGITVVGQII